MILFLDCPLLTLQNLLLVTPEFVNGDQKLMLVDIHLSIDQV
jgi:hypothetical protein